MFRLSVAGHLCVDLVPRLQSAARFVPGQLVQVGPIEVRLGGCVPNTGLCLRDLGADVTLQAVVGDDALGAVAEALLGDRDQVARITGGSTSYSIVIEPPGADRAFWHHTGVNAQFDPASVSIDTDLLHIGYPPVLPAVVENGGAPLRDLFARAKRAGVTTSLDLAVVDPDSEAGALDWAGILDEVLPVSDVISPSVDDLRSMLGIAEAPSLELAAGLAERLVDAGAGVALVTAGRDGMALRSGDAERLRRGGRVLGSLGSAWASALVDLPAEPLAGIVTSTGAGDAASAGLLYSLSVGLEPRHAARVAAATSVAVMTGRRPDRLMVQMVAGA